MSNVYKQTESKLWTSGHYAPSGEFFPNRDHGTDDEAASFVHYLNGGNVEPDLPAIFVSRELGSDLWTVTTGGNDWYTTSKPGDTVMKRVHQLGGRAIVTYSDGNSLTARHDAAQAAANQD